MAGLDTTEKTEEKKEDVTSSPEALFRQVDRLLKDDTVAGIEKGAPAKFFDAEGKPVDNLVGRKEPVISISVDENGDARVAIFPNGQAARDRKVPELLVIVSRTKDADVSKETRKFVEPSRGGEDKPTATVVTEINKKENTATITAITGEDQQTVKFKNGLPLTIDQKNSAGGLHCEIGPDGKITKLEINGKEPDATKLQGIIDALQQTANLVAVENGFPKPPRMSYKDAATLTERPAGGDRVPDKVIDVLKDLTPEQRLAVERTQELQGQILLLVDKMKFNSDDERKQFIQSLKNELGVRVGPNSYSTLPTFGDATKEGFKKLIELHQKAALPGMLLELEKMQLPLVPGCPLEVRNDTPGVVRSTERFYQDVQQGKGELNIDPNKLEDLDKLRRVNDWLESASNLLENERFNRLEKYLSQKVEDGITGGKYPEGWRRPKDMDVKTWCVAVDKAIVNYEHATKMIEMIDHLQKSGKGFKSDALKESELPPGLTIERDKDGKITKVKFDERLMISDLSLQSDNNRKKLDVLDAYCAKFEAETRGAMLELLKDQQEIPGYGEAEVKGGWISPDGKEFVVGNKDCPHEGWQKFNLISYNMKVETDKNTGKIKVSTECSFEDVPWFGYLNSFADTKHVHRSKSPKEYDPDAWVAVQTRPIMDEKSKQLIPGVQFVKARDLDDFVKKQALEHYGNKAIMFTMDAAMAISGGLHVAAALKVAQLGAKEAVVIGAKALKTEAVTDIPKLLVARALAKGSFEIGLGVTGIFHNAGAHEIPWMSTTSDLRSAWFLGHAGYSVAQLLRLQRAAGAVLEATSPAVAGRLHTAIDTIRGTESTMKAMAQAQAGAMHKLPAGFEGAEKVAQAAFYVSDKAFLSMFSWDMIRMGQRLRESPDQINKSFRAFRELNANDSSALEKFAASSAVSSDHVGAYLGRYRDTLVSPTANFDPEKLVSAFVKESRQPISDQDRKNLVEQYKNAFFSKPSPEAVQQMDQIIARMSELSKPGSSPEARQKYAVELMQYLRYSGSQISDKQGGRSEELAPQDLLKLSGADHKALDPNVRRIAALALLSLTRKPDGSWDETVAKRTVDIPPYNLVTYDSEGNAHTQEVKGKQSHQKVSAKELIELLQGDLRAETNDSVRLEKALAMHDVGLISNERLADMLMKRIDGTTEQDKGKRLEAIVDLAALMSKVKLAESVNNLLGSPDDKHDRNGLTIGLTHADLTKRVEDLAASTQDKDVRNTLTLALAMMKKDSFDQVDKQRMETAFLKKPPGISEAELTKMLRDDLNSSPTDTAGWERKLIAAELLSRQAVREGKLDLDAARALKECVNASKQPAIALRATQAFLEPINGVRLLDRLEKEEPKAWRTPVLGTATNLLLSIDVHKATTPAEKLAAAKTKEALIPLLTKGVLDSKDNALISNLNAVLQVVSRREKEGVQEIRAAAIKGMAALNIRDDDTIKAVTAHLKAEAEPSPLVRLAAAEAFVALTPVAKTRMDVLGPLAATEKDPAVRAALEKYFRAAGDINDAGSQKSEQAVSDKVTDQNKKEIKRDEQLAWIRSFAPRLVQNENLTHYFDSSKETVKRPYAGTTPSFDTAWRDATALSTDSRWSAPDAEGMRQSGREELIRLELIAQNKAFNAYKAGIDDLAQKARAGSTTLVDKTFFAGQEVTESEAAILALGWLSSAPPQLGKELQGHRTPNPKTDPKESGPYIYPDYTPEQKRTRERFLRDEYGRGLVHFDRSGNPGDQLQERAATKLAELATMSEKNINVKLVADQLLAGLKSDASTSDKSRLILIGGLEKILANPNVSDAEKRDIVKRLSVIVADTKEAKEDKQKSLVAMTTLLDRHLKVFEKFTKESSDARVGLQARAHLDSVNTPPDARMAAQQAYDSQWQSVVSEYSRLRAGSESPRDRANLLPKDLAPLEIANKKEGHDERVHEAVQKIILATKGEPLKAGDPRLQKIMELTDEKYDQRVRMAAMMALSQSSDATIKQDAAEKIYNFAITSLETANGPRDSGPDSAYDRGLKDEVYNRALRNDAFKLLETLPPVKSDTSTDLAAMRLNLETALSRATGQKREALAGKSPDELIKMTSDYAKQKNESGTPAEKAIARELTRRLHLYGEANTLLATQRLKSGDKAAADTLYTTALTAFGLDKTSVEQLTEFVKVDGHKTVNFTSRSQIREMHDKLIAQVQETGSFPALLNALNGQARLNASNLSDKGLPAPEVFKSLDRSIALLGTANLVSSRYHPPDSVSRAELAMTIGDVYKQIGAPSSRVGLADRWNSYAANFYDHAAKNLQAVRTAELRPPATTTSVDEPLLKAHKANVLALVEKYHFQGQYDKSKDREKVLGWSLGDVQKALDAHPDKNSPDYHFLRFTKSRFEALHATGEQKEAAKKATVDALQDHLTSTRKAYGSSSQEYSHALSRVWLYYEDMKEPEKAVAFFEKSLADATQPNQRAERLALLGQYYTFMNQTPRLDTKQSNNPEYTAQYSARKAKQTEKAAAIAAEYRALVPPKK
ncbi:MAG: hypothetical protein K2W95_20985 [Candidatus Obscuribacterales bacterium]|nr:hypothetical protein [Candidatus Obscuribacterales bacterium]